MHAAATSGKWGKAVPKPPPDVIRDPLISTGPPQKLLESEHSAVSVARRSDAGAHALGASPNLAHIILYSLA